jgi:hypothetical protein
VKHTQKSAPTVRLDDFVRLPGLFRRWEVEQVIEVGTDFHLEEAGTASDGTPLLAVYRREPATNGGRSGTRT